MLAPNTRKLVIGGAALVKVRLKNTGAAMVAVCDEVEGVLTESAFFAQAPFKYVNLIIRYGLKDSLVPVYQRINKAHLELPISVEVDANQLVGADAERVKSIFRRATIDALLHIAQKYGLPDKMLQELRVIE
jgi:hypothetical protein